MKKGYYVTRKHEKYDKVDQNCKNFSGIIKHCIDIQV